MKSLPILPAAGHGGRAEGQSWLAQLISRWRARPARQLRLRETLSLGERRFLALVEVGQRSFLVGGTGSSLTLLAHLPLDPAHHMSPEDETAGCGTEI